MTQINQANADSFLAVYTEELREEIRKNPTQYLYGEDQAPKIAARMMRSMAVKQANIDTNTIRRTCRKLGVPYTMKGIAAFLTEEKAMQHKEAPADGL